MNSTMRLVTCDAASGALRARGRSNVRASVPAVAAESPATMSRSFTTRRLARAASVAVTGVLAAACLNPGAASAAAPPAIPGWTMGSQNGAFAFSTTAGGVGTVWADGSRKTAVQEDGDPATGAVSAWSSDGNRVLLTAAGKLTVHDVNPWTGKLVETVTDSDEIQMQGTSVSPDGLRYAWGTPDQGVRRNTVNGGVAGLMTHGSAGTAWSRTDRLLWINDDRDAGEDNDDPGVFAADGASEDPPTELHLAFLSDEDNGEHPKQVSISADGTRLAYSSFDNETQSDAIHVSSAENSSSSRFLETGGGPTSADRYAAIAPDGTKVAFASDRSGAWAIYTAKWDGSSVAVVPNTTLPAGQQYTGLAWQPSQAPDLAYDEISSATEVGSSLAVDVLTGNEQGTAPLETTYKWQRCDDGTVFSCADIGVTTERLPLTSADVGHRYRVVRTVTNPAGADTLPSEITEAVVTVDSDPPAAPLLFGKPGSPSRFTEQSFGWSGAEPGGSFACSLDHAAFAPCTTAKQFTISGDGPHSFRVRQIDDAQNPGAIAEHVWTLDTTSPSKPVVGTKPAAVTKETSATITFSGDESNGTFECRLGAGSWDACASPSELTQLTDGAKRLSIRQLDAAGNASDAVDVDWVVDTAVPAQPTITTDLTAVRTTSPVEVAFTGEDAATFSCSVDGGTFAPCASPAKLEGLTTGEHRLAVRQTDAAGNTGAPREAVFQVDVTGPAAPTLTGKPAAFVRTPRVVFAFTGADPDGSGFQCELAEFPGWEPCVSGVDVDGLPEGTYTLRVRQLDAHGTPGEAVSHTWTYDETKPFAPTLLDHLGDVRTRETQVRFTGERPDGTFECRLDLDAWEACSSPATVQGYATGPHTFAVREIDQAGNVGAAAVDPWTADLSGPAAPQVTARPDERTEQTTATVQLDLGDPHGTVEYALDGGAWSPTDLPLTLSGLGVGEHVLLVRQTDTHGNHGDATRIAWTVVAPSATPAPDQGSTPVQTPAPATDKTPASAPTPAPAVAAPATTTPAKAPTPAAKPKLTAVVGGPAASGASGTSSAATITVKRDGVGVGCAITGTVLRSCRVDLYVAAATGRAANGTTGRRVLVGTGEYRASAGSRRMTVDVTLNATGRELLRTSPHGLQVAVAITGRPAQGAPLKASGVATLVARRTSVVVGGFAQDRTDLTPAARRELTRLAKEIRGTAVAIRVVGHTDGGPRDPAYLLALGERRARTVAAFLRAHGVRAKATLVSMGAKRPRASNATEAGRALNRRVELRIDR